MAIKPVSGEIKSQDINDNLSYLDSETTKATNAANKAAQEVHNVTASKADKYVEGEVRDLSANKADKGYVDSALSGIASGSPKGFYSNLSALKSALPSGAQGIYITRDTMTMYLWISGAWQSQGPYNASEPQAIDVQAPTLMFDNRAKMTTSFKHRVINIPKGQIIFGASVYLFNAQEITFEEPGTSERFFLYYNIVSSSFRVLWRSTLTSVVKYEDILVGAANPQTNVWYINADVLTNPSTVENIRLDAVNPIAYQVSPIDVKTNILDAVVEVTFTFNPDLEIYIGSNYYYTNGQVINRDFLVSEEAAYIYYNIIANNFEVYSYTEIANNQVSVGSMLVDRLSLVNYKSSGKLKYVFNGVPIGGGDNAVKEEIDGIDYSVRPFFSAQFTAVTNQFLSNVASDDITFAITTDVHVLNKNQANKKNFSHLKNFAEMSKFAGVDYSFLLGDISDGSNTKDKTQKELSLAMKIFDDSHGTKLAIRGNHDNNFVSARTDTAAYINKNELYSLIEKRYDHQYFSQPTNKNSGAFAHKNEKEKLIIISLNSFDYIDNDVTAIETAGYGKEQILWLVDTLKKVPADYSVIFMMHDGISGTDNGTPDSQSINQKTVRNIIEAFQNGQNLNYVSSSLPTINKSHYEVSGNVDFTGKSTNRIIACFSGHWHWDKSDFVNGVRHICIASSLIDATYNGVQRDWDTYSEDSFKLVAVDRRANKIKFTAFGGSVESYTEHDFPKLHYVYDPDDNSDGVIDEEMFNQLSNIVQDYKTGALGGTGISFEKI